MMEYTTIYSKDYITKAIEKHHFIKNGFLESSAEIINCGLKIDKIFTNKAHKQHKDYIEVVSVTPPVIWTTVDAMDNDKAPIAYHFDRGAAIIPILEDYAKLEQLFYDNKIIKEISIAKIFSKDKKAIDVGIYSIANCYLSHLEALWDLRYCYLEFQVMGTMKFILQKTDAAGIKKGQQIFSIEPLGQPTF